MMMMMTSLSMKLVVLLALALALATSLLSSSTFPTEVEGFSMTMIKHQLQHQTPTTTSQQHSSSSSSSASSSTRRDFFSKIVTTTTGAASAAAAAAAAFNPSPVNAATTTTPQIYNLPSGIKYAVLKDSSKGSNYPQQGDIIAIEYTGYLTSGQIFDASHSEGKQNALLFKLGSTAVIPGINEMVSEMKVGQKVQAIIPPSLAFGDKGICLDKEEDGSSSKSQEECLVKPGSTLVYDIYLKKASIPPP